MADEKVINQEPDDGDSLKVQVMELENLLAHKDEELAQANARLSEMEKVVAESKQMLAQAVSGYKAMVVKANPVLEELIIGDTVDEVNASVAKASALVNKVRQGLAADMAAARVPAGAPERTVVNLEALSPREKIQYAIGGRK